MRRWNLGKAALIALGLVGAAQAQHPVPGDPNQIVVIREAGKPEQRCVIEFSFPQADGKTLYYVRDMATGERLRVIDARGAKNNARGPILGQVTGRLSSPSDAGMAQALQSAPPRDSAPRRTPTAAELAGAVKGGALAPRTMTPQFKPKVTPPKGDDNVSPVQAMLNQLSDAIPPKEREEAAMVLAVSEARTMPEVVKALMGSARHDPAASVRTTCVRCLYKLSTEAPDVVPVLADCRNDSDREVSATAAKAMEEIDKRSNSNKK
jgi:hypothetical protein